MKEGSAYVSGHIAEQQELWYQPTAYEAVAQHHFCAAPRRFWDWTSGNNFQAAQSVLQPGSLDSEANICACAFDATGTRLLTAEGDKTIKFWRQDESATPETHPVNFRPPRDLRRF